MIDIDPYQQDQAANSSSASQDFRILENDEPAAQPAPPQPEPSQPKPVQQATESPESTEKANAEFTRSLEGAWVVQLGSFGNQKNVNDLLRKLEKAGYRSFSRKVQTSAGRLTKVFVGPELDKEKLDLALPHLKETTGLTGKVTTFSVVSN